MVLPGVRQPHTTYQRCLLHGDPSAPNPEPLVQRGALVEPARSLSLSSSPGSVHFVVCVRCSFGLAEGKGGQKRRSGHEAVSVWRQDGCCLMLIQTDG